MFGNMYYTNQVEIAVFESKMIRAEQDKASLADDCVRAMVMFLYYVICFGNVYYTSPG